MRTAIKRFVPLVYDKVIWRTRAKHRPAVSNVEKNTKARTNQTGQLNARALWHRVNARTHTTRFTQNIGSLEYTHTYT
jgi:demethoxyubiquinone hydroxylase (CLK1/Coq7/Cat5 family)